MSTTKLFAYRWTPEDRRLIAAIQRVLREGGYSASATDAIRYALRRAAPADKKVSA